MKTVQISDSLELKEFVSKIHQYPSSEVVISVSKGEFAKTLGSTFKSLSTYKVSRTKCATVGGGGLATALATVLTGGTFYFIGGIIAIFGAAANARNSIKGYSSEFHAEEVMALNAHNFNIISNDERGLLIGNC
jgi:hypothetical protein